MNRKHRRDELRSVKDRNFAWRNRKEEQIEIKMCVCSRKIPFLVQTVHVHVRISMQNAVSDFHTETLV